MGHLGCSRMFQVFRVKGLSMAILDQPVKFMHHNQPTSCVLVQDLVLIFMCLLRELIMIMLSLRVEHLMEDTLGLIYVPDKLKIALVYIMGHMLQVWLWEKVLEWHPKQEFTGTVFTYLADYACIIIILSCNAACMVT